MHAFNIINKFNVQITKPFHSVGIKYTDYEIDDIIKRVQVSNAGPLDMQMDEIIARSAGEGFDLGVWDFARIMSHFTTLNTRSIRSFFQAAEQQNLDLKLLHIEVIKELREQAKATMVFSYISNARDVGVEIHTDIYDLAISTLSSLKSWEVLADLLAYMNNNKLAVSPFAFEEIARSFTRHSELEIAEQFFNFIRNNMEVKPTIWTYLMMGKLCKDSSTFIKYLDMMKEDGLRGTISIYNAFLNVIGEEGEAGLLKFILKRMKEDEVKPTKEFYTKIISTLGKIAEVRNDPTLVVRAAQLFETMKKESMKMDEFTYNSIIYALRKGRQFQKMFDYFIEMQDAGIQASVYTYHNLMGAYLTMDDLEKVIECVNTMKERGIEPNEFVWGSLLEAYARSNKFEEMESHFKELVASNKANIVIYTIYIKYLGLRGQFERMMDCFNDMKKSRIQPNALTYGTVIHCLGKDREFNLLQAFVRKLHEDGYRLDVVDYTSMIGNYGAAGEKEKMFDLLKEMQKNGIEPQKITYTAILHELSKLNDVEEMENVFKMMIDNRIEPDNVTYLVLIKSSLEEDAQYARSYTIELADKQEDASFTYSLESFNFASYNYFKDMKQRGITPNTFVYSSMIYLASCARDTNLMEEFYKELIDLGIEINAIVFCGLVNGYGVTRQFEKMESVVEEMKQRKIAPNRMLYNIMAKWYGMAEDYDKMTECIQRMRDAGFPLDNVFQTIMSVYKANRNFKPIARFLDTDLGRTIKSSYTTYTGKG